jgi:hypothetical protein
LESNLQFAAFEIKKGAAARLPKGPESNLAQIFK